MMRVGSSKHGGYVVILLTRLNGSQVALNADLIERVESTGDTVVSLIDGTKYVVAESPADVVELIIEFRARVLAEVDAVEARRSTPHTAALRLVVEQAAEPAGDRADASTISDHLADRH
jgi:flagellar protein FlbD